MSYEDFITRKLSSVAPVGFRVDGDVCPEAFDYQRDAIRWTCGRGRAALWAGTGLGKTLMQTAWADQVERHTSQRVLILAPLAVAMQTVREADRFGLKGAAYLKADDGAARIAVTNYDRLHGFNPDNFGAVVLDESSILKAQDGATRRELTEAFSRTPFRLACTATPAPNDLDELGNHAEFLGICTRVQMLATYFVHDGGETQVWRLKRHAVRDFWRWVASWALLIRKPSDLGYDDTRHRLPALNYHQHTIAASAAEVRAQGGLFAMEAQGLDGQRKARKASLASRVAMAAEIVAREPSEPWLLWCDLNDEADALVSSIPGAAQIAGSDAADDKEARILDFAEGRLRVLVTKPSIAGFGVNWQHCARVIFVGVTHSWETYYQAVRRCWRFGQTRPVEVHVVTSELEGAVVANLMRKEAAAEEMASAMVAAMGEVQRAEIRGASRESERYVAPVVRVPSWLASEVA